MPALNELMNSLTAELDATTALLNRGEEDNWSRGLVRISNDLKAGNTDAYVICFPSLAGWAVSTIW